MHEPHPSDSARVRVAHLTRDKKPSTRDPVSYTENGEEQLRDLQGVVDVCPRKKISNCAYYTIDLRDLQNPSKTKDPSRPQQDHHFVVDSCEQEQQYPIYGDDHKIEQEPSFEIVLPHPHRAHLNDAVVVITLEEGENEVRGPKNRGHVRHGGWLLHLERLQRDERAVVHDEEYAQQCPTQILVGRRMPYQALQKRRRKRIISAH
mmetsp:Transcript_65209/g.212450  ORF Transcript_65209/g.212450 Transcript_65209/m.212450 type:complete len:205 (+) Transcript_65209:1037-1651(+)